MLLDTLDEMYDFIIVHAPAQIATNLFAALQGRFDAGVLVSETRGGTYQNGTTVAFLGFDVADFPVLNVTAGAASGDRSRAPRLRDKKIQPQMSAG